MAQFDVYFNSNLKTRNEYPFLVDVQADVLSDLATRLVIALRKKSFQSNSIRYLNPEVKFKGEIYVLETGEMAGIHRQFLTKKVGNMAEYRKEIIAALDFAFVGF